MIIDFDWCSKVGFYLVQKITVNSIKTKWKSNHYSVWTYINANYLLKKIIKSGFSIY